LFVRQAQVGPHLLSQLHSSSFEVIVGCAVSLLHCIHRSQRRFGDVVVTATLRWMSRDWLPLAVHDVKKGRARDAAACATAALQPQFALMNMQ
jgi:hypothetical protein